jgi:TatD DNase family protein
VVEWFDSHCHLQGQYLDGRDEDVPGHGAVRSGPTSDRMAATIARASEAGVTRLVCIGTDAATSGEAVELVRGMRRPDSAAVAEGVEAWATIGLHPHDAVNGVGSLDALLDRECGPDRDDGPAIVVGIGECGLDYHYDHSPRDAQRAAFAVQIELAARYGLALVVHTREAWDDTVDLLTTTGVPERTIIHCFTGGAAEARRFLDLGAALSFSGVVTFKSASEVREAAALCPLDRLLVETDSPFLTPVPHRGSANEPARVPLVGAAIAAIKGSSSEVVAEATTANAQALFAL